MKNKNLYITIGITLLVILVSTGVIVHSLNSLRSSSLAESTADSTPVVKKDGKGKAPKDPTAPKAPKAPKGGKGGKGAVRPEDLPPEVMAVLKQALPDAAIKGGKADPKKGQYRLQLAWADKTGSARLTSRNGEIVGSVDENLPADAALPAAIMTAFKEAFPNATIENTSKRTTVGGANDGQSGYSWSWGNNCDGEASADGKWIRMQAEMDPAQLPQTVTDAVAKAFPDSDLDKKAIQIIENGAVSFEFAVKPADGGKKVDVRVSADGTLTRL
jgi:hypothetical protein